ncbi:MAG: F0F1 ATP synthase subunit B [Chloroflexota bacterium]
MQKTMLKRFLVILAALSLVLALFPAASFAQDGEGSEEDTTEQVEESAGESEDEAHGGEEESDGLEALGINTGFLFGQIINITVLFALLGTFLWRPAVNMMNTRSAKIQKGLEDAAAAARARQNAEAEADKILAEARAERQKMLEEARTQGDEVKKSLESEARQDAERIRTEANADAETAKAAALAEVRDDVLRISSAVAARILDENIDASKNSALVSDFLSKLPDGAKNLSGAIEVISAMPLTDAEKSSVESAVGGDSYSYTVDPSILGGLIVRSQDKVVDGSVRGNLNEVTSRLK